MKIKLRLNILILITILPLTILNIIVAILFYYYYNQNVLNTSRFTAKIISNSVENYINTTLNESYSITEGTIRLKGRIEDNLQRVFNFRTNSKNDKTYLYLDKNGQVLAASNPTFLGVDLSNNKHISRVLLSKKQIVSDFDCNLFNNYPIISFSSPILIDNQEKGFLLICVNLYNENLKNIDIKTDNNYIIGIIDKHNLIYGKTNKKISLLKQPPSESSSGNNNKNEKNEVQATIENKKVLGYIFPIKNTNWSCYVTYPIQNILDKAIENLLINTFILLTTLAITLLMVNLWKSTLIKPLKAINKAVNQMRTGDYSVRIKVKGNDELSMTAKAFNQMAESIENNDKLKTQFFTNISHELKTPLNIIFASVQLLSSSKHNNIHPDIDQKLNHKLSIIKQNSYRLMRLVNNLIDISKYENGFLKINLANHNIVSLVEDITMSVVKYASFQEIFIIFDTDEEEIITACDPDMLERIVMNLLSNAIKFTPQNGQISVIVHKCIDEVFISVIDTGWGIPKEKIPSILERFYQLDTGLSKNKEGSGIGLSLVKALVESHNGRLTVESEIGVGSNFTVVLPIRTVNYHETQKELNSQEAKSKSIVERINIEFSDIYKA